MAKDNYVNLDKLKYFKGKLTALFATKSEKAELEKRIKQLEDRQKDIIYFK